MPRSEGSSEAVVRSFVEALSAGDLDGVARLLHEYATWTIHAEGLPGAGTHEGRAAIVEGFLRPVRGMFEPGDPKVEIERLVCSDNSVAVEARGSGRFANCAPYRNTYAFFFEVEVGTVTAVREYMDSLLASTLLEGTSCGVKSLRRRGQVFHSNIRAPGVPLMCE